MKISASYYSSVGGRDKNEDAASILESGETVLGVVADGLGGHTGGELASRLAVRTINAAVGQDPVSAGLLRRAIEEANRAIWRDERRHGMKSTVAALWFDSRNALAATVGDTRVYQFRDGGIAFQSRDHSVTQMAVQAGELDARSIRGSRERNRLVRALGAQEEVKVDLASLEARPGDAFLLCSDGFWANVWEEEMLSDLSGADTAAAWLARMRGRVEERAGASGDNHTAVAILLR